MTATSPDGQIRAAFGHQGEKVEIAFQAGTYISYSETSLAHELSRLAMRVTASYVRAQEKPFDEEIPDVLHDDGIEYGLEDREYRRRVAAIKTGAKSSDGRVMVASQSLARWTVRIAEDTVRRVSEERFKDGFLSAIREVLAQHQFEVMKLKDEYYDLGFSNETRRRMGLPERRGSR